ncbi:long-chain fatty acid--CoA ligase [candidate division WOR-3 bacterium]|nr:long-chain fatty acid--CoA ligase [candidate division WOR-3 bacterium]
MAETLYFSFLETAQRLPSQPALMHKVGNKFRTITYGELNRFVDETAAGLQAQGVKPGMRVGIYSYNRPEWPIADLAAIKLGAVVVPIYHTLSVDAVCYILNEAEVSHLFIESPELLAPLVPCLPQLSNLQLIITFFEQLPGNFNGKPFVSLTKLREQGARFLKQHPDDVKPHQAQPDDLLTICYTSGTTGEPKGAMLSHRNILTNARAAIERFNITEKDRFVSFLPLCHMFERTCGYYTMLLAGATIAYAQSIQTIREDVAQIKPTVLLVVPRVLEKVYNAVQEKVLTGPPLQRRLMIATLKTSTRCAILRSQKKNIPLGLKLKKKILDLLVVRKLRRLGGGRIRIIMSGGAPLERKLARTFRNLGFNLLEGYGLTETAPVVCAAVPGEEKVGTVGKPFPGVQVKIGENDEILVRGVNVMKGYFKKPEETARAIDAEGWFHTGDQGRFDADGNLIITGRIKELIVNSYGKNIPPVPIEQALINSKYIEQAVVFGDRKPYLVALIVPARLTLEDYARQEKIPFGKFEELLNHPKIIELFRTEVARATAHFASYEQVRKFRLIPEPLTVENNLLTPTLKVRRQPTYEMYKDLIESMYQEE